MTRLILRDWEASAWHAGRLPAVVRLAKRVPENARRAERLSAEHFQYWAGPKRVIIRCPLGPPGQRLWIAETWGHDAPTLEQCRAAYEDAMPWDAYGPYYRSGEFAPESLHWRSPATMPQWASRSTAVHLGSRLVLVQELAGSDDESVVRGAYDKGKAAWDANAWVWLHRIGRA